MSNNYFVSGQWNVICDRCGRKYKASVLREEWTGFMVCHACWEPRQPQDFVETKEDKITTEWARKEQPDNFISVPYTFTPDPPPSGTFD